MDPLVKHFRSRMEAWRQDALTQTDRLMEAEELIAGLELGLAEAQSELMETQRRQERAEQEALRLVTVNQELKRQLGLQTERARKLAECLRSQGRPLMVVGRLTTWSLKVGVPHAN